MSFRVDTAGTDSELLADKEDERLHQLGIRRELRKEFTNFTTLSFATGILGCAATIASTFNTPILLGGRATAIWSWFVGSFGCLAIAASVSELVSAYPTAGGIYTSTAFVVPQKYRASVTFVNAWMTIMGQLAAPASVNFALSQMIFGAVTIGTDGTFVASVGQVLGLYVAITVALGILNSLPTRVIHKVSTLYVYFNMLTTFAVIIAIPAAGARNLASSGAVWTGIDDRSGWNSRGFSFLLGLLCVQWVMIMMQLLVDMSEEVKNAAVAVPVAIVSAVIMTAVLGFFVNISLCYGIRDITALPGPTGLVFSQILWDNLGKRGALVLWSLIIMVQTMVATTCQLACVRTIYAISRDNALPDRKLFAKVWDRTGTPVNAVVLTVIVNTAFGMLYLASFVAINAVFSITAVALDLSYMIPIFGKVCIWLQRNPEITFTPGPFYMGKWGYAVNIYAMLWTCLETGVLIMPQVFPVTSLNMNYTGPIMGAVCSLSWLWYQLYWHRYYIGPGGQEAPVLSASDTVSPENNDEKGQRSLLRKA